MGFETPTPIQAQAIPIIQKGQDLIGCAQTGTGKTAAFVLPILDEICRHRSEDTFALIVVPTRELAIQIDQAVSGFSYFTQASSLAIYGGGDGHSFEQEKRALTRGANIIIATPGRLMSHLNMGYVKVDKLEFLVLDEADRMLDMGFVEDIMKISSYLPKSRQTLMFSATMPPKIRSLATRLLKEPAEISLAISKPAAGVSQSAYLAYDKQKIGLIREIIKNHTVGSVLIFAGTKIKVKELERDLQRHKIHIQAIHSDLEQAEREEVLRNFRSKRLQVLVATDIMSRGIDIEDIGLVINYDVPRDAEDYIHRIGRTARAETTGEAITFISDQDQFKFLQIENLIGYAVVKKPLPEGLGEGPAYEPGKRVKRPEGGNKGRSGSKGSGGDRGRGGSGKGNKDRSGRRH